jgi:hypothetical protein
MTLIVQFMKLGISISDLLITVEGAGSWSCLPSVGTVGNEIESLPFHATRLVRKVGRLPIGGRNTSFLIAGTVSHVEAFLQSARGIVSGEIIPPLDSSPLDRKSIESVLHHAKKVAAQSGQTDLALMGLRGKVSIAILPSREYRTFPYFGPVMIAGSGASELELYLERAAHQYESEFSSDDETMKAFRVMHYLPMQLLLADRRKNSVTLSSGVGGFYEVFFNLRGNFEPDDMWLRIAAEFLEHPSDGVRIRALWWHIYDEDDLIVAAAPDERMELLVGKSVLLAKERFKVERYGTYTSQKNAPPPLISELLPRIPRSRFATFTFYVENKPEVIATTMATLKQGPIQVRWSSEGLILSLRGNDFDKAVVEMSPKLSKLYSERIG